MKKNNIRLFSLIGICIVLCTLSMAFASNYNENSLKNIDDDKSIHSSKVTDSSHLFFYVNDGKTLKKGDAGQEVATLQKWLAKNGYYSGAITSKFDESTEEALIKFQSDMNSQIDLEINGILNKETVNAMVNWDKVKNKYAKEGYTKSTISSESPKAKAATYRYKKYSTKKYKYSNKKYAKSKKTYTKKYSTKKYSKAKAYYTKKSYKKTYYPKKKYTKAKAYYTKKSYKKTYYTKNKYTKAKAYTTKSTSGTTSFYRGKGVGDCWDNSNDLYTKLTRDGKKVRIIQYKTSYSARHRSVQISDGKGSWSDYDYKSNGYAKRYYATKNKSGFKVIR